MTTIDHRILIPAPPDVVWDYVSDVTHNPDWQVDCREVIFLTSRREGPGVRWRYASPTGRECVVAVTAWYNGLGYEYYFVDGMPFRDNKGRIRLQEIPEGTIVQWTFTYELGGVFGGMRNALGMSRQVDHTIAESLKTLWQKIKQAGGTARVYEPKSLMRDAPDVEARSSYQPRHPSPVSEENGELLPPAPTPVSRLAVEPPITEDDAQRISILAEPPVSEDDTRPRRPVTPAPEAEVVPPDVEGEPEFLERMVDLSRFEPPRDVADTQPKVPAAPAEPPVEAPKLLGEETEPSIAAVPKPLPEETEPLGFTPPELLLGYTTPPPVPEDATVSSIEAAEETQPDLEALPVPTPEAPVSQVEPVTKEPTVPAIPEAAPAETPVVEPEATAVESAMREPETEAEPPVKKTDGVSIWEIFGVPRPSETQEAQAAASAEPIAAPVPVEAAATSEPARPARELTGSHIGLRITLRRRLVQVRRIC